MYRYSNSRIYYTSSSFGSKFLLNQAMPFPPVLSKVPPSLDPHSALAPPQSIPSIPSWFSCTTSLPVSTFHFPQATFHYIQSPSFLPHMYFLFTRISDSFIYATCLSHFILADLLVFLYVALYQFHYYDSSFLFH